MFSKGGYLVGGFQEGLGSLKGFCGVVESSSLKKCLSLKDRLRFWNSRRIDVEVGGAEGGINFRPRLSSFVSNLLRLYVERLWILLLGGGLNGTERGSQNLYLRLFFRDFFVCGLNGILCDVLPSQV